MQPCHISLHVVLLGQESLFLKSFARDVEHCSDEKGLTEALQLYCPGVVQSLFSSAASFLPFCLFGMGCETSVVLDKGTVA